MNAFAYAKTITTDDLIEKTIDYRTLYGTIDIMFIQ